MLRLSPYLEENYFEIYGNETLQADNTKLNGSCKKTKNFDNLKELSVVSNENIFENTLKIMSNGQKLKNCSSCGEVVEEIGGLIKCKTCKRGYCKDCVVTSDCCKQSLCNNCQVYNEKGVKINQCSECYGNIQQSGCLINWNTVNGQNGAIVNTINDSDEIINETPIRKNKTIFDMFGNMSISSNKNCRMMDE